MVNAPDDRSKRCSLYYTVVVHSRIPSIQSASSGFIPASQPQYWQQDIFQVEQDGVKAQPQSLLLLLLLLHTGDW